MYGVLGSTASNLSTRLPVPLRRTGPSLSVKEAGLTSSWTEGFVTDAEDRLGLGGTLARTTTLGTAGTLCGEKPDVSWRVSVM